MEQAYFAGTFRYQWVRQPILGKDCSRVPHIIANSTLPNSRVLQSTGQDQVQDLERGAFQRLVEP